MPHQCVKCSRIYPDGSNELLKGCQECGGKFFFFIRNGDLKKTEEITQKLSKQDKEIIEQDVMSIIGEVDSDKPIVLDLASINVLEPGKFELNLVNLFRKEPIVYKLEEGKYIIDVVATFKNVKEKK